MKVNERTIVESDRG